MSAFPTNILIAKAGGREALERTTYQAKVILAKTALKRIAERDEATFMPISPETASTFEETLHLIELRCLDLAVAWRRNAFSNEGIELRDYCSLAFDFRRVLSLGDSDESRVKGAIHLAAVGVLGDRSPDIRRFLNENPWPVTKIQAEDTGWAKLVLFRVADAFLRVVRKKNWEDLRLVAEAIAALRNLQKEYEEGYLKKEDGMRRVAALELVAFYQLAKAVELLGTYMGKGTPATSLDDVDFHLSRAIKSADSAGVIELAIMLRWIRMASRVLIRSTIWHQMAAYNSQMTKFKKILTGELNTRPLFELLPPQRDAIQEIMNTGNRAVVVEMPTSSVKTLLAEFRIIQTKVNIPNCWIAYLVPTRALVNQITVRLRRDLGPLGFNVEQATPAYELDALEEELLESTGSFDVLVTTPEKLDLLFRNVAVTHENHPLGMVVLDEAHNLGDGERGLRCELVLAMINRESPDTHFLLLTPFLPNAEELASWLDDERSRSVTPSLALDWQPNDQMIAIAYPKGRGRAWGLELKPLHVNQPHKHPIVFDERVAIDRERTRPITMTQAKSSKFGVAAFLAETLASRGSSIVLAYSPTDCWNLAEKLTPLLSERESDKLDLVREFVATEFGEDFALYGLLKKGIGVHHAGISPEIRSLLEWLTEEGELSALISTTTVAQGVNFPISNVILATHHKPKRIGTRTFKEPLRPDEFWNIAGRAGRLFQDTLGLVLFASQKSDDETIEKYVKKQVGVLASVLEEMIEETFELGWELDLRRLVKNDPKWSSFVQFLAHSYRVMGDHGRFLSETEKLLKRTYAYHRLYEREPEMAEQLVESTRNYAEQLQKAPAGLMTLVDNTGFSLESIIDLVLEKDSYILSAEEWSPSSLFQGGGEGIKGMVGALLKVPELDIPTIDSGEGKEIASVLEKWVSGKPLREIADHHFARFEDLQRRMTECCRTIYQKLTHQASWGFGALQAMSDLKDEDLSEEAKTEIRSVPSMIYFGVPTVEAVLMRNLNVPRSISVELGEQFKNEITEKEAMPRIQKAREWLENSHDKAWQNAATKSGISMNGNRLREAWRIISGNF